MDPLDAGLDRIIERLLADELDSSEFEKIVALYWESGGFVRRGTAPEELAERLRAWAERSPESCYGGDDLRVAFESQALFGSTSRPAAIHIVAPGEMRRSERLADKNRAPHVHESGRIAIITRGRAVFFAHRRLDGEDVMIEAPVREGDVIFWPAGTIHTFDAGDQGFSLFCALGTHLSPEDARFAAPSPIDLDLDALRRTAYRGRA